MTDITTLEQAKFIFSSIKYLRDKMFAKHHGQSMTKEERLILKDMSISQFHTIMAIRRKGKVSLKELSQMLQISPPSASSMVNRLVEKGVVKRHQSSKDRRKIEISLTQKALLRHERVEKAMFASFVDLIEKLGPDTTEKWCQVIEEIHEIFRLEDRGETAQ
ncbi:MAG: MarR family transcriptional regulator [Desulfobacteraceae bacterium]|nr:MarR family transcriptional regulator [Desulfobacteraceae bacterium]